MKKLFVLLLVCMFTLFGTVSKAQGEAALPFLLIAPDSRAGGIGESGGGLADNVSAIFWNPAGIAFLTGSEIGFTHSNWLPQFKLSDLFYDYATYRQYIDALSGSVTASITYMSYGEFTRTGENDPTPLGTFRSFDAAFTVGYATKIGQDWGLGLNFRLIHSRLADKPTAAEQGEGVATTVSFDIATMWRPAEFEIPLIGDLSNRFSLGINLSNLGPKVYYIDQAQADPIPTNFRLGIAVRPFEDEFNSLTITADFTKLLVDKGEAFRGTVDTTATTKKRKDFYEAIISAWADQPFSEELRDITTAIGIEYWYGSKNDFKFALRAGMFYEDPAFGNRKFVTLGAGVRYDMYGFDFGYITTDVFKGAENHPLNNTLRFSLLFGWGTNEINTVGFPRGI